MQLSFVSVTALKKFEASVAYFVAHSHHTYVQHINSYKVLCINVPLKSVK